LRGVIDWKATGRRLSLIGLAIAAATLLLHKQLSMMIVLRGDALAYESVARSNAMYERALVFDPENSVAADRLIFHAILSHDPLRIREALAVGERQLERDPGNSTLMMDRALCFQLLGDLRSAMRDFANVGIRSRDPRALLFAGDDAAKLGRIGDARRLLRLAIDRDPGFRPARLALERAGGRP
jgi:tetratricopeptide (TPR) repeat protein